MVQTEDGFLATVVAVHEVCTSTTILSTENRFPRMLRMLWTGSIPLNSPLNLLDDILLFLEADRKKAEGGS